MKPQDRARLTTALRDHVAKIAADLRAKMRAPGAARVAAEQLHKDERVADDFAASTSTMPFAGAASSCPSEDLREGLSAAVSVKGSDPK